MKRGIFCVLLLTSAAALGAPPPVARPKTRLVVVVVVDQMRYDYLMRFREGFTGGFARLLAKGAVFTNAQVEHYPTLTAVAHAALLSGATPALSGIIGNDWYEPATHTKVTSVSDATVQLLGAAGEGVSPRRLLVSTVGDELKMAGRGTRVIGLSLKDRAAILAVGRMADGAFWLDVATGRFVSSTYYFADLPAWVKAFNGRHPADAYAGREWKGGRLPSAPGRALYEGVFDSPFGNELLETLAEAALDGERLGQRGTTDLLTVSFSSNDPVGHASGPESEQVRDIMMETDRVLQKLLDAIDRRAPGATLFVLTADHGVAPVPETMAQRRMPGGRMRAEDVVGPIEAALVATYGSGKWVASTAGEAVYLDRDRIRERKLDERDVQRVAARAAWGVPHVARVYTREQLLLGQVPRDALSERVLRGFHPERSGDLEILLEPYWMIAGTATTHGTPYSYDSHVPLILMGPGIRAGRYERHVALNDLAPTLAALLEVETPSCSVGHVLDEVLSTPPRLSGAGESASPPLRPGRE